MTTDLKNALTATQENLGEIGVEDALVREVLSYRLLIERLGESDNNDWWESMILTELGRDRLDEVTPKTAAKARIDLAQRVGRKVEQDRTEKNTISLFYLGPTVEAQISAELEDISESTQFEMLESLTETTGTTDWTADLVDNVDLEFSEEGEVLRLGPDTLEEAQLKSRTTMRRVARECFAGYGQSAEGSLQVPYYKVEL
ncbi:BrxE family protein [Halomarina pelagica]|uniref:BrxE family protein n=1 Tax=Halomarina pelagica TaxID=2961599 RepID=UPI0020C503F8|nr:BrxE family protein [Halomarina sp. BND7]